MERILQNAHPLWIWSKVLLICYRLSLMVATAT